MKRSIFITFVISFLVVSAASACRFWIGTGSGISKHVKDQLLNQPYALKILGENYKDGWSVGYYYEGQPVTWRGETAANKDKRFDQAVENTSASTSNVIFAHLRRASSGCAGVPDPHPFKMDKHEKIWLFGHNGGMVRQTMVDLIGPVYMAQNPPVVCTDNAPYSWIDSELFFIFLMKWIEHNEWKVAEGLREGLAALYQEIPQEKRYLNFFLTDGQTIWVFRKGNSLFYRQDKEENLSYVSSTIPDADQKEWQEFPEDTIGVMKPDEPIQFIPVGN